eukprot:8324532-Karenia_brevis.AAC.1
MHEATLERQLQESKSTGNVSMIKECKKTLWRYRRIVARRLAARRTESEAKSLAGGWLRKKKMLPFDVTVLKGIDGQEYHREEWPALADKM